MGVKAKEKKNEPSDERTAPPSFLLDKGENENQLK